MDDIVTNEDKGQMVLQFWSDLAYIKRFQNNGLESF